MILSILCPNSLVCEKVVSSVISFTEKDKNQSTKSDAAVGLLLLFVPPSCQALEEKQLQVILPKHLEMPRTEEREGGKTPRMAVGKSFCFPFIL